LENLSAREKSYQLVKKQSSLERISEYGFSVILRNPEPSSKIDSEIFKFYIIQYF